MAPYLEATPDRGGNQSLEVVAYRCPQLDTPLEQHGTAFATHDCYPRPNAVILTSPQKAENPAICRAFASSG
jgi:hypothetical protein